MMTPAITRRAARYISVSALCAAVHNSIMIAGDVSGYNYAYLMFVSFLVIVPLAYGLHVTFTFGGSFSFKGLMHYAATSLMGFWIFFGLLTTLCSGLGMRAAFATPILTLTLFVWNYASAHWAISRWPGSFSHQRKELNGSDALFDKHP